ncbi:MAG: acyl carrier protein [Eubacterium sp.]|nr:acyl carrier protein [Eubacterium sp.]
MYFDCIAELIADRIGCEKEEVTAESRFSDLGIDSLDTVELLMELEDKTGVKVELTEKVETVGALVAFVEGIAKEQ